MLSIQKEKTLAKLIYIGIPAITIFLIDNSVTDPVNTPKFFLLGAISVASFFVVLSKIPEIWKKENFLVGGLVLTFIVISTIVLFTSKSPIVQSLYGVYGRNNGYLTYVFLCILLFASSQIRSHVNYESIVKGLLVAGYINVLYCGWVLSFGEILSWSNPYGSILGTLGNPNFIGAFLGMFVSVWFAVLIDKNVSKRFKFISIPFLVLAILEIFFSHAIQGRVLLVGGITLVIFYWLRGNGYSKFIIAGYCTVTVGFGALAVAGALQKGPLTSLIYKNSVSLRGQYWLAGWNTGVSHPLTGVGFDTFGDWYRRMRDVRAITLPGVNTVVNTAHNVPIDIFASGGWPLLISYSFLMGLVVVRIVKISRQVRGYDPVFVSLVTAWVTYQVQSLISINQIGIAVWGWVLSGLLIGYSLKKEGISQKAQIRRTGTSEILGSGIYAGLGLLIGALLAVPPLSADMKWRSAQQSRDAQVLEMTLQPAYLNPQNSYKYLSTIQTFEQSNLIQISHKYALRATKIYPDNYDSWKLLYLIRESNPEEKAQALKMMKKLDPLNPDVTLTQ